MADYGYSAGYRGMTGGVLPPGYLEAATAPGRNYGSALANIGQNVAGAIRGYIKNKEEDQYLTSKIEAGLAQYANVGKQGPLPSGQEANLQHLGGIVGEKNLEKFMSGKASRMEKLAIANSLETYADKEYKTLQTRLLQEQLGKVESEKQRQAALGRVLQGVGEIPTSTQATVTRQALDQYGNPIVSPGEFTPAIQTEGPPALDQKAYIQALEQYSKTGAPAASKRISEIQSAISNIEGQLQSQPQSAYIPTMVAGRVTGQRTVESPQMVAARMAEAQKSLSPLKAELASLQASQKAAGEIPKPEQFLTQPEMIPATQKPGTPVTETVNVQQPVSYEDFSRQVAQRMIKEGLPPTKESIDQIAMLAGYTPPMQVQSQVLPGGATAVQVGGPGGKVEVLPAPKQTEQTGLAINLPEFRGTAPSVKEAQDFREQYSNLDETKKLIGRLIQIANMGKVEQQMPAIKAEAAGLVNSAQAALRLSVLGPGTITEADRMLLNKIISDPTKITSFKSANIALLQGALDRANSSIKSKANALGLEVLGGKSQQQPTGSVETKRSKSGIEYTIQRQ